MNAPVFLLHPGKQVTQGCNREITPKKNLIQKSFSDENENVREKKSQNGQMKT